MTKLLTLTNDFHNTAVQVREGRLSARTAKRVKARLCCDTCTCSGGLGTRGRQAEAEIEQGYDTVIGRTTYMVRAI